MDCLSGSVQGLSLTRGVTSCFGHWSGWETDFALPFALCIDTLLLILVLTAFPIKLQSTLGKSSAMRKQQNWERIGQCNEETKTTLNCLHSPLMAIVGGGIVDLLAKLHKKQKRNKSKRTWPCSFQNNKDCALASLPVLIQPWISSWAKWDRARLKYTEFLHLFILKQNSDRTQSLGDSQGWNQKKMSHLRDILLLFQFGPLLLVCQFNYSL